MQHFAKRTIGQEFFTGQNIVVPDFLFEQLCQYFDTQNEPKKWTAKSFQMSISKYLGIKANVRDRSNHGDKMLCNLGESAEEFVAKMKENKLYSRF